MNLIFSFQKKKITKNLLPTFWEYEKADTTMSMSKFSKTQQNNVDKPTLLLRNEKFLTL